METIIVAYDDTEPASLALRQAAELARALAARLIVTTVSSLEEAGVPNEPAGELGAMPEDDVQALARARAFLEKEEVEATYQPAIGDPADAIVEIAERNDADLIVVGTRDPGAIQRMFGYSVSQGVLRRAHCSVLVVRR